MDIVKNYDGKELTIQIKGRIDTVTAPDFENEINDEIGKFDSMVIKNVNDAISEIFRMSGFDKILKIE